MIKDLIKHFEFYTPYALVLLVLVPLFGLMAV